MEGQAAAAHAALLLPLHRALDLPPLGPPVLEPHLDHRDQSGERAVRGRGRPMKKGRHRDTEGGRNGGWEGGRRGERERKKEYVKNRR